MLTPSGLSKGLKLVLVISPMDSTQCRSFVCCSLKFCVALMVATTLLLFSIPPAYASKSPLGSTQYVFTSCQTSLEDETTFSGSFCSGYIIAFLHGYMSGQMDSGLYFPPEESRTSEQKIKAKFCLPDIDEFSLAKEFVAWINKIPEVERGRQFMRESAASPLLTFMRESFPCK